MNKNPIILSSQSRDNCKAIRNRAEGQMDVFAIAFDACIGAPIGRLLKTGYDVVDSIRNDSFFRKFARFLDQCESLSDEEKERYVSSLSKKDYERIRTFLLHVIDNAEEDVKAEAIGKIYKARILNIVGDESEMLRLCSIVNRSFFEDLNHLGEYTEVNNDSNFITGNLMALGLLEDCGNVYRHEEDGWEDQRLGPTKYRLNPLGSKLRYILTEME